MKKGSFFAFILLNSFLLNGQNDGFRTMADWAVASDEWIEGFDNPLSGHWIDYHSHRNDCRKALILRAMEQWNYIEWESAEVDGDHSGDSVTFVWIAGYDMDRELLGFDLLVDGEKQFEFNNLSGSGWTSKGLNGGTLVFLPLATDQHGDGFGYMKMTIPSALAHPGRAARISITTEPAGSTKWYMTFACDDALQYLQESEQYQAWFDVKVRKDKSGLDLTICGPAVWAGETVTLKGGESNYRGVFKTSGNESITRIRVAHQVAESQQGWTFGIAERNLCHIPSLVPGDVSHQVGERTFTLIEYKPLNNEEWSISCRISYLPNLAANIRQASTGPDGRILLMNSSHQDIAWMDSPEKCILERDTMLISPLLEQAQKDDDYRFDIEDVLMVREYLERHPEKKASLGELITKGQISVGATYTMPYEEMYGAESLARQFYLGKRWLMKEFTGYEPVVYWNPDIPGRSAQIPQLMSKAGVPYLLISRHEKGVFRWMSPDGSDVLTYSPGHYSEAYTSLNKEFSDASFFIARESKFWKDYYRTDDPVIPLLSDWDMSPARDYSMFMEHWDGINCYLGEDGKIQPLNMPPVLQVTGDEFFRQTGQSGYSFPSIQGERPNVWIYIHGPSHYEALKASREADWLLPAAEKFQTIRSLLDGHFNHYPTKEFAKAWEAKIYPDHGWGGKNGEITDALFQKKFEYARDRSAFLLDQALQNISGRIHADSGKGVPVVVFNSLSWDRTAPARINLNFYPGQFSGIEMVDRDGAPVQFQPTGFSQYPDGSVNSVEMIFLAHVPSMGYSTYYLRESDKNLEKSETQTVSGIYENENFSFRFGNGGITGLFDKKLNSMVFGNSRFNTGEVITMQSVGNGAGEFAQVQQPGNVDYDRTGNHAVEWKQTASGPVFDRFEYRLPFRNTTVHQELIIFHSIGRIDFNTHLLNWDGSIYREFRQMFPLKDNDFRITYEVPFGKVTVGEDELPGAAGERYIAPVASTRPRGINRWIDASNDRYGVTFSSSVAAWDYLDPSAEEDPGLILQPLLLASRKSCHGEGNEYLQTGSHSFSFTLFTHFDDWRNGYRSGIGSTEELIAVVPQALFSEANLPEKMSFFSLEGDYAEITALKKEEDGTGTVFRIFNAAGTPQELILNPVFPIAEAWHTDLIERNRSPLSANGDDFRFKLPAYSIETYKLNLNQWLKK